MSHLLAATRGARGAASEEEWNVRSERRRVGVRLSLRQTELQKLVGSSKESRGVAASSSETRADRDALRQTDPDAAARSPRREQLPRTPEDVPLARGKRKPARREHEAALRLFEQELVLQRHRLHHGVDLVIAVAPLSQDPETQVDLRGTADPQRAWRRHDQIGGP